MFKLIGPYALCILDQNGISYMRAVYKYKHTFENMSNSILLFVKCPL